MLAILIDIYRLKCGLENLLFCFFFAFGGIKFQKKHVFLSPYSIFYTRSMFFLPLFGYEISWIPATQVAAGFNLHFFGKSYPARQQNRVKASCWLLGLAGPRFLRSNRGGEANRQKQAHRTACELLAATRREIHIHNVYVCP